MTNSNRRAALLAGATALVAMHLPARAQTVRGVTPQTIRLGAINSMTGPLAAYGIPIRAGTVAYLGQVNAAGGVNGRKIELAGEDNVFSTPQTLSIARKMVAGDGIFALINTNGTAQVSALLPYLLDQEKIPVLATYGGAVEWFNPARPGLFGTQVLYEDIAGALGRWVGKDGHKKVMTVHIEGASFAKAAKAVEPAYKAAAPQGQVEFLPVKLPTQDYAPIALQIMQSKPDAIIAMQTEGEFLQLARELRNQGSKAPIYVWGPVVTQKLIEVGGASVEGVKALSWTTSPLAATPQAAEYRAALAKFAPAEKPDFISLFNYAQTKVTVEALRRIRGSVTHQALFDALYTLKDFETGILPPVSFAAGRHQGVTSLFPMQVKSGAWSELGKPVDTANPNW
ncbi:MAG TPA: ABC transporter substrate-binding protein [Ramlibacter sp.]|nr:ABC transporter substrate-binding protein [Ramlibacter sp.]